MSLFFIICVINLKKKVCQQIYLPREYQVRVPFDKVLLLLKQPYYFLIIEKAFKKSNHLLSFSKCGITFLIGLMRKSPMVLSADCCKDYCWLLLCCKDYYGFLAYRMSSWSPHRINSPVSCESCDLPNQTPRHEFRVLTFSLVL